VPESEVAAISRDRRVGVRLRRDLSVYDAHRASSTVYIEFQRQPWCKIARRLPATQGVAMRLGSKGQLLTLAAAIGVSCCFIASGNAQGNWATRFDDIPTAVLSRLEVLRNRPTDVDMAVVVPSGEWRSVVDARWGEGLPTDQKLAIFDAFWTAVDHQFAAFQGLEVDWAALRLRYRPEVAAGVSRGRFAAIMNHLALALRESHTQANDVLVNFQTFPTRGLPLFEQRGWIFDRSGACVTPQDDGSALVYAVSRPHPLGLEPGDRILGYDGRPWKELYHELLDAELPISPIWWGSSDATFEHSFLMSSTNNFHLFDSIDVLRMSTAVVEHLPTRLLDRAPLSPFCSEQLDVPGIPKPNLFTRNFVTWGLFPGTRIGYIFGWGWTGTAGVAFEQAVRDLTQLQQTDGLIIDFRFNVGGNMFLSNPGLALLFEHPVPTIGFAVRAQPDDHLKMLMSTPPFIYVIPSSLFANQVLPYEKPIAVLTGPGALSSGDQVALRMTFHPRVRTFGKSTATAFNAPRAVNLSSQWSARIAVADAFRIDSPHDYLTHDDFIVDDVVWLQPQDVASARDTVVEAALRWIHAQM